MGEVQTPVVGGNRLVASETVPARFLDHNRQADEECHQSDSEEDADESEENGDGGGIENLHVNQPAFLQM